MHKDMVMRKSKKQICNHARITFTIGTFEVEKLIDNTIKSLVTNDKIYLLQQLSFLRTGWKLHKTDSNH